MCDGPNTQRLILTQRESSDNRHTNRIHHKHLFYVSPPQPLTSPTAQGPQGIHEPASRGRHAARRTPAASGARAQLSSTCFLALVKTASSIWPVTLPVNVFCWLGW